MATCGFRPFPGNGAYGHWTCTRPRLHLGRHRYRNYTIARVPRVWRLHLLWVQWRHDAEMHALGKSGYGYRRILFPTEYEPV